MFKPLHDVTSYPINIDFYLLGLLHISIPQVRRVLDDKILN